MTTKHMGNKPGKERHFYQKLFWFDFFGDTKDMNGFEQGVYALLIGNYFINRGPLPDDNHRLARMTQLSEEQWLSVRPAIAPKFGFETVYGITAASSATWPRRRLSTRPSRRVPGSRTLSDALSETLSGPIYSYSHIHSHSHLHKIEIEIEQFLMRGML
jgi:uncharacterized protein DUF1376